MTLNHTLIRSPITWCYREGSFGFEPTASWASITALEFNCFLWTLTRGARKCVCLKVTLSHFLFSMLKSFKSWLWNMKGRKNGGKGPPAHLSVLLAFQTTFKFFSLICKISFWVVGTSTMSPLKRRKRGKSSMQLPKKQKKMVPYNETSTYVKNEPQHIAHVKQKLTQNWS